MPSVDNRVVRMEFDNAEFERRIGTTLTSLKDLEKALKMEGAKKGLTDVSDAAGKVGTGISTGLSGAKKSITDLATATKDVKVEEISKGIENVSKGFIAMSTVAITALANVTTSAIRAGAGIAKSLGLQNVIAGFQEYETNMNSIQTILANTKSDGSTLQDVNSALDQLNTYSDKTIYNFSQMARNIGTFTAAGVDLKTSTSAIKGIANLAAVSGSSADQASTAMYQLSQALAAGKLTLMDWNSVVNAGMGGEVFKKQLFEAGKALGTLKNVPMNQTFDQWEKAGHKFRETLQDGWITTDVLTTTLGGLSGELDEAALKAKGFSDEGAKGLVEMGQTGLDAAQDIKTFTQLIDTTKEAIGSGWSQSFRLIIGDFEEAKVFFSGLGKVIGTVVGKMADSRNKMLGIWKFVGGRNTLITAFQQSMIDIYLVLKPIREAFRDVFPKTTGIQLAKMTENLRKFLKILQPSESTVSNMKRIFEGLFSIMSIGIHIITGIVKLFASLVRLIAGGFGPGLLGIVATFADFFTALREGLVDGGGITAFFNKMGDSLLKLAPLVQKTTEFFGKLFGDLFGSFGKGAGKGVEKGVDGISSSVEHVGGVFAKFEPLLDRIKKRLGVLGEEFQGVGRVIATIGRAVGQALSVIGQKLAESFSGGNFNKLIDGLNVALGGGLLLLIRKFIKQGLKIDFTGGLFDKIGKTFETLTGTLKSLQLQIKAQALMKIAQAIAVLTASVVVLSLIDSDKLTKALSAMAVGFGQLIGVMAALKRMQITPRDAAAFGLLAGGLILVAGAMALLSLSARILGPMDWDQLAKGLGGVVFLLVGLVTAAKAIAKDAKDLAKAGASLLILSISILILSRAAKAFAKMDMGSMGKGFAGLAIGLAALAGALHLMPKDKDLPGGQLILTGIALKLLAGVVEKFAGMDIKSMAQGFAGIGLTLGALAAFFRLMPPPEQMAAMGGTLIGVSIALLIIAKAIGAMGKIAGGDLAKGLTALALALGILAVAANAMEGALPGAAAILVMAGALVVLVTVIKMLSLLGFDTVITGMLKLSIALGILGLTAAVLEPVIPALIGLAAALTLIGAAFALFGAGAYGVAAAFAILNEAGKKGTDGFIKAIKAILKVLPTVAAALARFTLDFVGGFLEGVPFLVDAFYKAFSSLLDVVIKLIPKFQQVLGALIVAGMATIRTYAAEYIKTGLFILTTLLQGISNNIGKITDSVIQIVLNFINAIKARLPEIIAAGLSLLVAFLQGITQNLVTIAATVTSIITTLITEIGKNFGKILKAGADTLANFIKGIADNLITVANAVGDVIARFIRALGDNAQKIIDAGVGVLLKLLEGIRSTTRQVADAFTSTVTSILSTIASEVVKLTNEIARIVVNFVNGMADAIRANSRDISDAFENLGEAMIDGLIAGIGNAEKLIKYIIKKLLDGLPGWAKRILGAESPAKTFIPVGETISQGIAVGIDKAASETTDSLTNVARTLIKASEDLSASPEFNPTITPVLDLTKVAADAKLINSYIPSTAGIGGFSTAQANTIAASEVARMNASAENSPGASSGDVKFEQNIYAPDQLSMADIYKQTRNQIIMAKEELKIP